MRLGVGNELQNFVFGKRGDGIIGAQQLPPDLVALSSPALVRNDRTLRRFFRPCYILAFACNARLCRVGTAGEEAPRWAQ